MDRVALQVWVSGHVQGVWYRQSTLEQAELMGVEGWIRNLADGRVEAILVGPRNAVLNLETWMNQGPPLATVAEVVSEFVVIPGNIQGFEVR